MLTEAAERLRGAGIDDRTLVRADALQLPFTASSVDLVVCTESFHWYPDQVGVLNELARVVKPGGRLLIASIATTTDVGDRLLTRATGAAGRPVRALPPRRMRELLASAGYDVIAQRRVPRLGPIAWPILTDARRH
jgi:ubiquinone/menaquinone biosynthesis C-methylase UbiE